MSHLYMFSKCGIIWTCSGCSSRIQNCYNKLSLSMPSSQNPSKIMCGATLNLTTLIGVSQDDPDVILKEDPQTNHHMFPGHLGNSRSSFKGMLWRLFLTRMYLTPPPQKKRNKD